MNPEINVDTASPVALCPTLSDADRHRVLVQWNQTERAYPRDKCIHQLFEEQVEKAPDAVAVVCEDQALTYRELDAKSNQLAHYLRQQGTEERHRIALYVNRSFEYVIGVLAVLKAGCTYVPLAEDFPADRLRFMLRDCGASTILTTQTLPFELNVYEFNIIDIKSAASSVAECSTSPLGQTVAADSLAYVMYTSGSTGRPKGVGIPQRSIVRLVRGQDYVDFGRDLRVLLLAPTSFDASTFELWAPLLNGGVCVIFPNSLPELEALERTVRSQDVNCLWLTTGLFNQIVDSRPSVLASVSHVLAGGDVLSVAHVKRALELYPTLRLTNGYGPTEGTTFSCTHQIDRNTTFSNGSIPIGRPLSNTRCYILDELQIPVPIGEPGELYIGGDGLAEGYLNLPELTSEAFIPDPFSNDKSKRLYRTGDFARYFSDGTIEFLGRRDLQVKIRGFRIELSEIEVALQSHSNIKACAVAAQPDLSGEKQLVAFLVLRAKIGVSTRAFRKWLAGRLADHLIPTKFIALDVLPLTPNGKIDRQALATLKRQPFNTGTKYVACRTSREHQLVNIWTQLLQCNQIGIHDNFFDLGGHSLQAVQMIGCIHQQTGVMLPLSRLFENPTIHHLAIAIAEENLERSSIARDQRANRETAPAIFLLEWLLDRDFLELVGPRSYVIPFPEMGESHQQCRVEYLADTCLATLRTTQPHGPVVLIGYSLAGAVAYEMACRMEKASEGKVSVAIIDLAPASWGYRISTSFVRTLGNVFGLKFSTQLLVARSCYYLLDKSEQYRQHGLRHTWRSIIADARRITNRWRVKGPSRNRRKECPLAPYPDEAITRDRSHQPFGKFWAHRWAYSLYRPQRYDGNVTLFVSDELRAERREPGRGWKKWAGRLREYPVPGTHSSCITTYKNELAQQFRECLDTLELSDSAAMVNNEADPPAA